MQCACACVTSAQCFIYAASSLSRGAGQTCVCANRVFVHASVFEEFREKLLQKVRRADLGYLRGGTPRHVFFFFLHPQVASLVVGNGLAPGVTTGPLISAAALARVDGLVRNALAAGAGLLAGGSAPPPGGVIPQGGHFYAPTVLDMRRVDAAATPCDLGASETFGPVAPLHSFEDEEDVIRRANSTDVGLAAYAFTRDLSRAWRIAERLEVGMIGINTGIISVAAAPFGGVKQSGFGREGGSVGLAEYTSWKYIMMAT